ncbi:MAG: hypothetical protein KJZ65_08550 [Phycisphaerales bacterium]|nr:hypothetical protein [Phycisphaerales bacterium]
MPVIIDHEFGDFAYHSCYQVHEVIFTTNVIISDITTYFTNATGLWGGVTTAVLNIYDHSPTAADDPRAGTVVVVSIANNGDGTISVRASGLGIALGAGSYWVGLTPFADFGVFGQEFHLESFTAIGSASPLRNPGGGFGYGTNWAGAGDFSGNPTFVDGAILINGVIPAPGAVMFLGLGGLLMSRRRR